MQNVKIVKLNIKKGEKLTLTNDGELSLFWLGVGSAFSKKLFQTNLLIVKGKDHLLIDCASRFSTALFEYGLPLADIRNILITHSHADHIGGLEEVALVNRYMVKKKPTMVITEEYEELLWDYSLRGGCAFNERHNNKYLKFSDFFNVIRPEKIKENFYDIYNAKVGKINIKMFNTMHIPDSSVNWKDSFISYGIIIDERILFTSDTKYDPDLIKYLLNEFKGIEVIFHDCQLFKGGVHASYEELLEFPESIRQKMFLTHYQDSFNSIDPKKDKFVGFTNQASFYIFK